MRHPGKNGFVKSVPLRSFLCVVGTRPEVIKMAPVIRRLQQSDWALAQVATTGQQSDLLTDTLADFDLRPDIAIRHRRTNRTPAAMLGHLVSRLDHLIEKTGVDGVIGQGDTTSVFAAATAAFYRRVPFVHIEAGLRTGDLDAPFPEEFHRKAVAIATRLHCAPTKTAAAHLLGEQIEPGRILICGNTVIDALLETAAGNPAPPADFPDAPRTLLLTAHRRENFGAPLREAFQAIRAFVDLHADTAVYFPVHPNPQAREAAHAVLSGHPRIRLAEPLPYRTMVAAMQKSWCIVTDSGGLQEEAPALGKPVLVLRDVTERPEAVASGVVDLIGTERAGVFGALQELAEDAERYAKMARRVFPYGDGQASRRIVQALRALHPPLTTRAAA